MVHATFLLRFSAVSVVVAVFGFAANDANAQDLARVNQDELASFYGRMNVVVGSGARAFGMGGAFLARADDATAASWNPAGLSYLRRTEFSLVGVHNDFRQGVPKLNSVGAAPIEVTAQDQLRGSVADFLGFAYPFRLKDRAGAVQISYQRSFSFTGTRRAEGTVGVAGFLPEGEKILPTEFTVDGKGGFDTLSLSSGLEIHPRLRAGLSINRWINGFSQTVNRPDAEKSGFRRIESDWDISGTNFNFGLLFTPAPKLNIGAVFKTSFDADLRLTKIRTDLERRVDPATGSINVPQVNTEAGDVGISFPRVYGLGASYRATNTITFSADFTRTAWSKAIITDFFSLAKEGPDVERVNRYGDLPFPAVEVPTTSEGGYRQVDSNQVRVGGEWVLRLGPSGNVLFPVRIGFFRDAQPVTIKLKNPDGSSPEIKPSFSGLTAGVGVTVGNVLFDLAYIREAGNVPASRNGDGNNDSVRDIRYGRVFASMMVRFGPRR